MSQRSLDQESIRSLEQKPFLTEEEYERLQWMRKAVAFMSAAYRRMSPEQRMVICRHLRAMQARKEARSARPVHLRVIDNQEEKS